ncbi:MAG: GntR family transcriptional regulator [Silicimonas sp.]|nr:GntR family transcriptional regulator [Silicimonas sp.]NND43505.1 GntR family transcriptional regulator [Silicimonas sp.]NNF90630.1 GntR family transcriptional regulator [Boseongicola sp.]NNL72799.1 GntR family transcriptional regulator [Silicimonas sp.]RZW01642.1 MAG: GntR family transcriptional regulator [Paracoccaceae bacterium]
MSNTISKLPEHQGVYRRIRNLILFGTLVPGQAVTIQGLADLIGGGMTPVREAIRRLTAEGALEAGGNRRVRVPQITRTTLEEIAFARLAVEPRLTELAAGRMTDACLDDLRAHDAQVDEAILTGDIERYLEYNYRFHFRLYDQADARILRQIAASLWLQIGPSLRIVCGRYGTANLPDKHSEALAALVEGDSARSAAAIADDIRQGIGQVRLTLDD